MTVGLFKDPDFQRMLLKYLCRDKNFLKDYGRLLREEDFRPRKGEAPTRQYLAGIALRFWRDYGEPLGGMIRTEALDFLDKERLVNTDRHRLLELVEEVRSAGPLVAAEAMGRRVVEYKNKRARQQIVQEMLDLEERGDLTNDRLLTVAGRIYRSFGPHYTVREYGHSIARRTRRRYQQRKQKWPLIMIPEIDRRIRLLTRGMLGLILAQYKVGKSVMLIWIAHAMAAQALNVLYITLEDPLEQVEDRFDGLITEMDMKYMVRWPRKVKETFREKRSTLKGRIKIVDGTDGGVSVQMIEQMWERERDRGFNADVVIVDYDDEIEPPRQYREKDGGRRFEFADIYRELRKFAARKNLIVWTAAQARRGKGEDQMVVTGEDAAEDISKVRKVALCIGVGMFKELDWKNGRYLYVAAHKWDVQRIGFGIVGDFNKATLYLEKATRVKWNKYLAKKRRQRAKRGKV